jgi:type I restriction enzyme, S subunit
MPKVQNIIADHLNIWTTAIQKKSSAGRGPNKKISLYGIKKLRELILELAVRGRLVPQDPNDEPASVLLKKISIEKTRLINDGKIKKQKTLLPITEDEKPFELPQGWEWIRLGNMIYLEMGQSPASEFYNQTGEGLPFFQGKADFGPLFPEPRSLSDLAHENIKSIC